MYQTEFVIQFNKINDTTFEGTSRTIVIYDKKYSDTAICILRGGFLEKNILYLEETRAIKRFTDEYDDSCLQFMKLYYTKKKNHLKLNGKWYTKNLNCGSGDIRLTKVL